MFRGNGKWTAEMSPLVPSDEDQPKSSELSPYANIDSFLLENKEENNQTKDVIMEEDPEEPVKKNKPVRSNSRKKKNKYSTKMSFIKEENDNESASKRGRNDIDEFITSSDEFSREATAKENILATYRPSFRLKRHSMIENIEPKPPIRIQRTFLKSNALLSDLIKKQRQSKELSLRMERKFKNELQDLTTLTTTDIKVSFDSIFKNCELNSIFDSRESTKSRLDNIQFCKIKCNTSRRNKICYSALNKCRENSNALANFELNRRFFNPLNRVKNSFNQNEGKARYKAVSLRRKTATSSDVNNQLYSQIDKVRAYLVTPNMMQREENSCA